MGSITTLMTFNQIEPQPADNHLRIGGFKTAFLHRGVIHSRAAWAVGIDWTRRHNPLCDTAAAICLSTIL